MKMKQLMAVALALGLTAWNVAAQDGPPGHQNPPGQGNEGPGGPPPDGGPDGPPPDGASGGQRHRPPPFMVAMDTNHDGTLSAAEIADSATTLLMLDKKGDGTVTMEEFLGPRPGRGHGGPGGDQNGGPTADQSPGGGPQDGNGPGNQGKGHRHPPVPAIFAALDTNGDGVLSADEIANAPKNLLKLDKNGDGQLTPDELRPQRPPPRDSDSSN
jgi:hypothetical protein